MGLDCGPVFAGSRRWLELSVGRKTRPPDPLRLLHTRAFDGSSLLLARYVVER